jgi:hypothetical protein
VPGAVNTPLIGGIDPCRTRPPLFPVWSPSGQLAAVRLMREKASHYRQPPWSSLPSFHFPPRSRPTNSASAPALCEPEANR